MKGRMTEGDVREIICRGTRPSRAKEGHCKVLTVNEMRPSRDFWVEKWHHQFDFYLKG